MSVQMRPFRITRDFERGELDEFPTVESLLGEIRRLREESRTLREENAALREQVRSLREADTARPVDRREPTRPAQPVFAPSPGGRTETLPPPWLAAPAAAFDLPRAGSSASIGHARPDQGIDFGAVSRLSPDELDRLPYGLITLDAHGRILHYNDTESRLVGLPKERVLCRNFFAEVAPCTRVREFQGQFEQLARDPQRVRVKTFDFVFRFANGEQHVTVVATPARVRGQYHLALIRRA